ncbi:Transcriptional regulator, TetR family protein [Minicystis rosea]|nr:Transcriptional regulator, TetR family protein [Minicystis rosea]
MVTKSRGRKASGPRGQKAETRAPDSARTVRDATKAETREALIRAGMELFAEQGLDVPSLDALCARAGFTRGAFYVHFRDREDFIVAVMEATTGSFLDAIMAARGQPLDLSDIAAAFAASVSGGEFPVFGKVPLHQFLAACARSPALRKRYGAILKETIARLAETVRAGQKAGTVRKDVDADHAAGLMIAIALGVGAVSEIDATFDMPAHAQTLLGLLGRAGR